MMGCGNSNGLQQSRHGGEQERQKARSARQRVSSGGLRGGGFLKKHQRGGIRITCVLLLGLFAVPVWLLVSNISDSDGAESLPNDTGLGAPKYNYFGKAAEVYSPQEDGHPTDLCVTFEFLGLNEATSQANFGI